MSNNQCNDTSPTGTSGTSGGGGGASSGTEGVEGEEQEESSSSSLMRKLTVEDALTSFREQWQRELESSPRHEVKISTFDPINNVKDYDNNSIESKAKALFLKGVEYEQNGKLYDAIQFYRRAVQLVPDIEFRLYETSKMKGKERQDMEADAVVPASEQLLVSNDISDEDNDDQDLLNNLQRAFNRTHYMCIPQYEQQATHISALPMEIILYIMRWVVSSDLDLHSLEACARVCRGFYLCCRDAEIWRLACLRVWGVNCGDITNYGSWRQMFIERPRLRFNGCYISKTTYIRHGENNFQDQFYRPLHLVEYFRYLRFFPEGVVLMLTTPDEPVSSVSYLRYRSPRNTSILKGHYRLYDKRVVLVLKRQDTPSKTIVNNRFRKRRDAVQDVGERTFHIELQILNHRKRNHAQLVWQHYSVITRFRNGQENTSTFDLPSNCYPSFCFCRVKSYTSESENPLQ